MKAIFVGLIVFMSTQAGGAVSQSARTPSHLAFIREWRTQEPTRGITKAQISRQGQHWTAQLWGACEPADCNWGEQPLHLLGDSIKASEFDRGLSVWDPRHATIYATFQLEAGELGVETYTVFKDGSNRSNYHVVNRLVRVAR